MSLSDKPKIKILNYKEVRSSKSKKEIKENIQSEQKIETVNVFNDNDIDEGNEDHFVAGDIVLQVKTFNDNDQIHGGKKLPLRWLFVDVKTYSEEDESYLVAQIKPNREIPFDINDSNFISAFKEIFNNTDWKNIIDEESNIKSTFWKKVLDEMNQLN